MTTITIPYAERQHPLFGQIKRPLITLNLYSERFGHWLAVEEVLVDTGADLSVVPMPLGQILIAGVESGQPIHLGGVISSAAMFNAFVHQVKVQIGNTSLEIPFAIATSATIPPILGRREALDHLTACFVHGQELVIEL